MNQWKPNTSLWYSLGLGVLLCIAVLVVSTGTAYARYRTERTETVTFAVREPEQICLGTIHTVSREEATEDLPAGTEVFTPTQQLQWETVEGVTQLNLAIANGISDTDFSRGDQKVRLQLLGTLGLWTGAETVKISLAYPPEAEETETLQAMVTPIVEGSVLYHTHGPGWIYSFQNTEGELSWTLPGGEFSYINLTVIMEGATLQEAATLQPRVTAEVIGE